MLRLRRDHRERSTTVNPRVKPSVKQEARGKVKDSGACNCEDKPAPESETIESLAGRIARRLRYRDGDVSRISNQLRAGLASARGRQTPPAVLPD